jgi:cobalamin biosynthesis protein CobT
MKRPENKKVLMVLSDGHPAFLIGRGADRKVAHQYLPDVIKGLSDTGMHVVGIGICSDAVKRYYPHWVVLDDIEGLPGAVMSQVAKILMGKRVVLDNSELMKASSLGRRRVA